MTADQLCPSARIVQKCLLDAGLKLTVREMPSTTRSAKETAVTIGCALGQIAKSIVFRGETTGAALLVIASGANRVNEQTLATLAGEPVARADADFVRCRSGFVIGGVPPVGHIESMRVFLDATLQKHAEIWAAAGTPFSVFSLTPDELQRLTGAAWIDIV